MFFQVRSPDAPIEPPKFLGTGMCDAVSRSLTLPAVTDDRNTIAKTCIALFDQISPFVPDLRGVSEFFLCGLENKRSYR